MNDKHFLEIIGDYSIQINCVDKLDCITVNDSYGEFLMEYSKTEHNIIVGGYIYLSYRNFVIPYMNMGFKGGKEMEIWVKTMMCKHFGIHYVRCCLICYNL